MTTPSNPRNKKETGFGSFAFGVAVGVGAALLLGTEEGRQFTSKLLDTLKDNLPPSGTGIARNAPTVHDPQSMISDSTPHTTTYSPQEPTF